MTSITGICFETWCRNHDDTHHAKWYRELYPWRVFSLTDYSLEVIGKEQVIEDQGMQYHVTVLDRSTTDKGRVLYCVRLATVAPSKKKQWTVRSWSSDFQLVTSADSHFITLYTVENDPSKVLIRDFVSRRFASVEQSRSMGTSTLLFRTLVGRIAEEVFSPLDYRKEYAYLPEGARNLPVHEYFVPMPMPTTPFFSKGRDLWLSCAFDEEKAHKYALYNSAQCKHHIVVYCRPTFTKHHRCSFPGTEIESLMTFLFRGQAHTQNLYHDHVRLLVSNLNSAKLAPEDRSAPELEHVLLEGSSEEMEIVKSDVYEARAAVDIPVRCTREAAYVLACANLLEALLDRARKGRTPGNMSIPQEAAAFKKSLVQLAREAVEGRVRGVQACIGRGGELVFFIGRLQFWFHDVRIPWRLRMDIVNSQSSTPFWNGVSMHAMASLVLKWARAVLAEPSYARDAT